MIKRITIGIGIVVGILAGIVQILTYFNLSSASLLGKIAIAGQTTISLPISIIACLIGVGLGYLFGKGRFKSHKQLTIKSAIYGSGQSVVDVTSKLASLVKDNSLTVVAGNHLAGDPIDGTVKRLEMWFSYGTSERKAIIREGRTLEIP